jgi:uncharacterized membrane protein
VDELSLARAVHVLAVVVWIGGVYLVTMVILPAVRNMANPAEMSARFKEIECRFGGHARVATFLAGASGFYMLYLLDGWDRYESMEFWWIHAMTLIWLQFTLALFILEPFLLRRRLERRAQEAPDQTFARIARFHYILLAASLITIFGAVVGTHG